jgi:hypothetical protein
MQIMMKKTNNHLLLPLLLIVITVILAVFLLTSPALAIADDVQAQTPTQTPIQITFSLGETIWQSANTYEGEGNFLLLRSLISDVGGSVSWLSDPGVVFISVGNRTLAYCQKVKYLYIGQNTANGLSWQKIYAEQPLKMENNSNYINRQYLSYLGMQCAWDPDLRYMDIVLAADIYNSEYPAPTAQQLWSLIGTDLKNSIPQSVTRFLSSKTTYFNANLTNRTTNIKLAAKAINGTVIEAGKVFSFNKTVGPRYESKGYKEAVIFVNGEKDKGIGGGVCQVSSTIYNAVLSAGLTVVERHAHSLPVTYVAPDRDATVSYGIQDFRFKNNTKGKVIITTIVGPNYLTVQLWSKI